MTFDDFERAEAHELMREARACFDRAQEMAGGAWDKRTAQIVEAQFYMAEISRRHDNKWIWISFGCELLIIVLIVVEICVSLSRH